MVLHSSNSDGVVVVVVVVLVSRQVPNEERCQRMRVGSVDGERSG